MRLAGSQHARSPIFAVVSPIGSLRIDSSRNPAASAHDRVLLRLYSNPYIQSAAPVPGTDHRLIPCHCLVAIHATPRVHPSTIPKHMDKTKAKRPIRTLTLRTGRKQAKTTILGRFPALRRGRSGVSLPQELPPFLQGPEIALLGAPLSMKEAAQLIGCSPWTVRQTLIPRGLPHFRSTASGRLIFYRDQLIRWIQTQQQGG